MQEERDDDLDNVGACIERLNSIGFAVEVYKTDSFDLGVPEKRPRLFFLCIHADRYRASRELPQLNDSLAALSFAQGLVADWKETFEALSTDGDHWQKSDLSQFLHEEGSSSLLAFEATLAAKLLAKQGAGSRAKGRPGVKWIEKHKKIYEQYGLEWSDVSLRDGRYSNEAGWESMVDREKDIILLFDAIMPLSADGPEETIQTIAC
jgi:site-specific DNA-cytosine methylase